VYAPLAFFLIEDTGAEDKGAERFGRAVRLPPKLLTASETINSTSEFGKV